MARLHVHLRDRRKERGWSQSELANRAGVSRQTVSGIEAGHYGPSVDVALRLSGALGCRIEDMFVLDPGLPEIEVEGVGDVPDSPERVALAEIAGRIIARPLRSGGAVPWSPGHGVAKGSARGRWAVERFAGAEPAVFLAGCDPALGLLAAHLGSRGFWWPAGNRGALEQLARRQVHAVGVHRPAGAKETTAPLPVRRIRLGWRQIGWIVPRGNPKAFRGAYDLEGDRMRLINREEGSGARALLDDLLGAVGLDETDVRGYETRAADHYQVAVAVALGAADVGIGVEAAARQMGCDFLPIAPEVCDIWIARGEEGDRGVTALLDTLTSGAFRQDLGAFGDYDSRETGEDLS